MTATTVSLPDQSTIRSAFTVERLLYGCILFAGVFLRFYQLGLQPLTPAEAAQSWPLWQAAQGLPVETGAPASASALLASLQYALFWLTQGGDVIARLSVALAGTALLFVPWLFRPWLGRAAALVLALLFAIDPWLVAFSRVASGAMISTTLALFCLACMARLAIPAPGQEISRGWLYGAAVSAGLLVVSGPLAWSYGAVLLLFALLIINPSLTPGARTALRTHAVTVALVFGLAAALAATLWLARPEGMAAVSRSLGVWAAQFQAGPYPFAWSVARVLVDQALLLLFAAVGLFMLWRQRHALATPPGRQWPLFLTLWLAWGLLWQLLPGRSPDGLLVLGIPLLFAAAHVGGHLLTHVPPGLSRAEAGGLLAVLFVLAVAARIALSALISSVIFDAELAVVTILLWLGVALALFAYVAWAGWTRTLWLAGIFGGCLMLLSATASAWQLAHVHDMQRPNGLFASVAHPNVRTLRADLATLSAQRVGDELAKPVQVQMGVEPDPLLAWYLRDRRLVDWVPAPTAVVGDSTPLVLTQLLPDAGMAASTGPAGTIGSDYHIRYDWLPAQLLTSEFNVPLPDSDATGWDRQLERIDHVWRQQVYPFLQWAVQRKTVDAPVQSGIQLWVMPEE